MSRAVVIPDEVLDLAEAFGFRDQIQDVFDLTQEMFPGDVSVEAEHDPEWPDDEWIAFTAYSSESTQWILDQELKWFDRVRRLIPDCSNRLRILIGPR